MMAKTVEEEKKRLKAIYGSVSDEINPETGYPYGAGIGDAAKLAAATGVSSASGSPRAGTGAGSVKSYIARLGDSLTSARAAALSKKYRALQDAVDESEAAIAPAYYGARNREAAGLAQSSRNYAEYAQAKGIGTGAAAQAELSRENVYRENLGRLNADEAAAYTELIRKRQQLRADLEDGLSLAAADGKKLRYESLIEQYRLDEQNLYKAARDAAADAKWEAEFKFEKDSYLGEWDYKLSQDAAKAAAAFAKASKTSVSAKTPAKTTAAAETKTAGAETEVSDQAARERAEEAAFAEGLFYKEPDISAENFPNAKEYHFYLTVLDIWKKLYDDGAVAIQNTVDYLAFANTSRTMMKNILERLPGWAGMTAPEMVARFANVPEMYGDMYGN